jgi:phenylalanyl-tRNA synthetase beta chain
MIVSYRTLKSYVEVTLEPHELADTLTAAGIKVDGVEKPDLVSGVFTGKVLEITRHQNSDHMWICKVDSGEGVEQIVTGAQNVTAGAIVPVARVGAYLPARDLKIKPAKLRGEPSNGMLCSADELGIEKKLLLPEQREGILILPQDTPIGVDINEYLGLDDAFLEIDLTPNRADCIALWGLAREIHAITGAPLHIPEQTVMPMSPGAAGRTVKLEAGKLAPRFYGLEVSDVHTAPSPVWMQNRLRSMGVRSVNNVVDITNLVMLEVGQPLHAYDAGLLESAIVVRTARPGEKIVTLDGEERSVSEGVILITDGEHGDRALGIAGIMGGGETEVTDATTAVFLESAVFDYAAIRRASREIGLRTEASARFDKGVDPAGVPVALARAAQLFQEINCGVPGSEMTGATLDLAESWTVALRPERVNALLGTEIDLGTMRDIFTRLGLQVDTRDSAWQVVIPSRRPDITGEADLIEEVARMVGYNSIPSTLPKGDLALGGMNRARAGEELARRTLVGAGASEVLTYAFIDPASVSALGLPEGHPWLDGLRLLNPLSGTRSFMRTTMLPGLLDTALYNASRGQTSLLAFEIGHVFFQRTGDRPDEPSHLGVVGMGLSQPQWAEGSRPYDFFTVKGLLEALASRLHVDGMELVRADASKYPFLHPGQVAEVTVGGKAVGFMGTVHPILADRLGFRQSVVLAEVDLDQLLAAWQETPRFQSVGRFPGVSRDLALVTPISLPVAEVAKLIRGAAGALLQEIALFDVYVGGNMPAGSRSLAFSLRFGSPERTLTEAEVDEEMARILNALGEKGLSRR